jgi:hypothetical protein
VPLVGQVVQLSHLSSHSRSGLHPHLRILQRKRDCNGKMRVDSLSARQGIPPERSEFGFQALR